MPLILEKFIVRTNRKITIRYLSNGVSPIDSDSIEVVCWTCRGLTMVKQMITQVFFNGFAV